MSQYLTQAIRWRLLTPNGYPDERLRRPELLGPAPEAGVRAWRLLKLHLEMLDPLHEAIAVLEPDGRVLFRNQALERLLQADPRSSRIAAAIEELVRTAGPQAVGALRPSEAQELTCRADVTTPRCGYTLWLSPVRLGVFGTEGLLVEVERRGGVFPSPDDIQARFALTAREAEVALLLAEGLDNRRIAERLSISPHTARRHTEAVLKCLDIGSRAAVAVTLLRQR
jgi:DNA-binding CsgD family transcriptional regulator